MLSKDKPSRSAKNITYMLFICNDYDYTIVRAYLTISIFECVCDKLLNFIKCFNSTFTYFYPHRLQPPIASTVRVLSVGGSTPGAGAKLLQLAPSGQHLVLSPSAGDPQLWHVMSNSRVHTFKGKITCSLLVLNLYFWSP